LCCVWRFYINGQKAVQYQNGATNTTSPNPAFSGNVQGICPSGWHIPANTEFQTLAATVSNDGNALKAIGQGSGGGAGTNTSGFSAVLSGFRSHNGNFYYLSNNAYYRSSTDYSIDSAYNIYLDDVGNNIYFDYLDRAHGFSVRCCKD